MQDSYIGCHDLLQTSQILLRDATALSRTMHTPALRHLVEEYRYFVYRRMRSWVTKYRVYIWLADNNRTPTNMASIDKIWRLIVYIRCYFMMSVEL